MAVVNTGIVLRTITGVNESDLFLDSESTSVATNTGIVERSIVGVHDANFVHPLGDEEILNGDFSNGSTGWLLDSGFSILSGIATCNGVGINSLQQNTPTAIGKTYKLTFNVIGKSSDNFLVISTNFGDTYIQGSETIIGTNTFYITPTNGTGIRFRVENGTTLSIDNVSVKEMLVNRESTATNTGIVERPITGVNESDPMFPDNTISNIVNIAGLISSLIADLKARATTFENEDATRNILINLQNC